VWRTVTPLARSTRDLRRSWRWRPRARRSSGLSSGRRCRCRIRRCTAHEGRMLFANRPARARAGPSRPASRKTSSHARTNSMARRAVARGARVVEGLAGVVGVRSVHGSSEPATTPSR
jgi:hypothetical protein